ncbi:hypothetical protein AYO37_01195 [Opitutia bacterium SCGC AG-212-L18]|nr:hypothetical protein AYO37_01195 [Opitutae bacterium SCGC AG-212-L18]
MRSTDFSASIMKVNALNALEHERFKILFAELLVEKGVGGKMNLRNTVVIGDQSEMALFHELTHKAMNDVFHNPPCLPYAKDDMEARDAYRESMRQVFFKLY